MTLASKQAFSNNGEKRQSDEKKILKYFLENPDKKVTYIEAAIESNVLISNGQKRCHDLNKKGRIKIVGKNSTHSLYQIGNCEVKLTKTEMMYKVISEVCPMFLEEIKMKFESVYNESK